jgi:uncharacterized protein (DUF924 family)
LLDDFATFEAQFILVPFQHCEDVKANQVNIDFCHELIDRETSSESPCPEKLKTMNFFLDMAYLHKKIVGEFKRYPHRNEALGRESTPEEVAYLDDKETKRFG